MRGEHSIATANELMIQGSSPHARGAPRARPSPALPRRIIPACAGSTAPLSTTDSKGEDHPRMRGEHTIAFPANMPGTGSSPHARGAPTTLTAISDTSRIIPAGAGSTASTRPTSRPRWDHPRMRGEHSNLPASLPDVPQQLIHFLRPVRGTVSAVSVNETYAPCGASTRCSIPSEASP